MVKHDVLRFYFLRQKKQKINSTFFFQLDNKHNLTDMFCPICKISDFHDPCALIKHVHSIHKKSIFICSGCKKNFLHAQSINRHLKVTEECMGCTKINGEFRLRQNVIASHTAIESQATESDIDIHEHKDSSDNVINVPVENGIDCRSIEHPREESMSEVVDEEGPPDPDAHTLDEDDDDEQPPDIQWDITSTNSFLKWSSSQSANLSEQTAKRIVRDYQKLASTFEPSWSDSCAFIEALDQTYDTMVEKNPKLNYVCNRLRGIHWIGKWRVAQGIPTCSVSMDYLSDLVKKAQGAGSRQTTSLSILAITDPYELVLLSNEVISILQGAQQEDLDPFIQSHFRHDKAHSQSELLEFGKSLRCWLDLAMRFTNVPTRIQCTIGLLSHLASPRATRDNAYVARLVLRGENFVRILNKDKVGNFIEPVEIPLCTTISIYMYFYLKFCRPDAASDFAFQSDQGCQWVKASRDIKAYLKEKGLDPDRIEPSGRIIHGSRHIGLATFAVMCNFDRQLISDYTVLMRHSMATCERIYSPWLRIECAQRALRVISTTRKLNIPNAPTARLLCIRQPCDAVYSVLTKLMQQEHSGMGPDRVLTHYSKADASTQTGPNGASDATTSTEITVCIECGSSLILRGPYTIARDERYFGKLWTECVACSRRVDCNRKRKWCDLGKVPIGWSLENLSRPRNLDAIVKHIHDCTGATFDTKKFGF